MCSMTLLKNLPQLLNMNKPISLIVIFVAGLVLLVANKASVVKYAREGNEPVVNVASNTENLNTNASTSPKKIEISDKATVIYSDAGFSPAVVKIKVGGTVTFVNKSNDEVFAIQGLQNEVKTHIFKFENEGEFAFSSVSHPELFGVVVVR